MQRLRLVRRDGRALDIEIDRASQQLWRGNEPVAIQPRIFNLLRYLIEHPGRVLDKDELHRGVWQTRFISSSALPRAIMKLRMALGDQGVHPPLIATVQRAGYRFDGRAEPLAAVPRETLPPVGAPPPAEMDVATTLRLRLSRVALLDASAANGGRPPAGSDTPGFATQLRHLLDLAGDIGWLPASALRALPREAATTIHPAGLCQMADATTAIICRTEHAGTVHRLTLSWGNARSAPNHLQLEGPSWHELAVRAACAITGSENPRLMGGGSAAQSQAGLLGVIALERQGLNGAALDLLEQLQPHVATCTGFALLHARLLKVRGRPGEAERCIRQALHDTPRNDAHLTGCLLTELAEVRYAEGDMAAAEATCDEAMHLLAQAAPDSEYVARALLVVARVRHARGDTINALLIADRAVALAVRTGNLALYLQGQLSRALYLMHADDLPEAARVLAEADRATAAANLTGLQCDTQLRLGQWAERRLDRSAKLQLSLKSAALAARSGDARREDRAWFNVALACVELADLGQAREVLDQRLPVLATRSRQLLPLMQHVQALHLWRSGAGAAAVALTEGLLESECRQPAPTVLRWHLLMHLVLYRISGGQVPLARRMVEALSHDMLPDLRVFTLAHLALAEGDRASCRVRLESACLKFADTTVIATEMLVCLAWLKLEDGDVVDDGALWQRMRLLPADAPHLRLLKNLMALASGQAFTADGWRAEAARAPGIVRRHGWLLDIAQAQALLRGQRAPLGELLYLACL